MAVDPKNDTGAYAPTKAPETKEHADEQKSQPDDRLKPGGPMGTPMPTGMEALDRDDVPSGALKDERVQMGKRVKP